MDAGNPEFHAHNTLEVIYHAPLEKVFSIKLKYRSSIILVLATPRPSTVFGILKAMHNFCSHI
jgi:hypothetical protein